MKKTLSLFLCLAMLFGLLGAFPVIASEAELSDASPLQPNQTVMYYREYLASVIDIDDFANTLRKGFLGFKAKVDIEKYNLHLDWYPYIFDFVIDELYDCFHVDSGKMFATYETSSKRIRYLNVYYTYNESTYKSNLAKCNAIADKLVRGVKGNSALNDLEKALILHDRLALHCEYDKHGLDTDTLHPSVYTICGVFVNKVAVCQGYAVAYHMLLKACGIESYVVDSAQLNHAWNIVYINGRPYHVDVTWDDATWDINGRVNHQNFMRSNEGIYSTGHEATDYDTPAVYDTYENETVLHGYTSAYLLIGNDYYYVHQTGGETEAYIVRGSDRKALVNVSYKWPSDNGGNWLANYTRIVTDGTYIYYNSPDTIYRLDLETLQSTVVYQPYLSGNNRIYGLRYDEGYLYYDIDTTRVFDYYTDTDNPYRLSNSVKGDINGNGRRDAADYALAKRSVLKTHTLTSAQKLAADVNGNGRVDASDYALIKRACLGTYIF